MNDILLAKSFVQLLTYILGTTVQTLHTGDRSGLAHQTQDTQRAVDRNGLASVDRVARRNDGKPLFAGHFGGRAIAQILSVYRWPLESNQVITGKPVTGNPGYG